MKRPEITDVVTSDLRALLFWASIGVAKSNSGSYGDEIDHILESYADHLGFKLPYPAKFGAFADRMKKLAQKAGAK